MLNRCKYGLANRMVQVWFALVLASILVLGLAGPGIRPARAATTTWFVTSTSDSPTDGDATAHTGSLRFILTQLQTATGPQTVYFSSTIAGQTITAATPLPAITTANVTLDALTPVTGTTPPAVTLNCTAIPTLLSVTLDGSNQAVSGLSIKATNVMIRGIAFAHWGINNTTGGNAGVSLSTGSQNATLECNFYALTATKAGAAGDEGVRVEADSLGANTISNSLIGSQTGNLLDTGIDILNTTATALSQGNKFLGNHIYGATRGLRFGIHILNSAFNTIQGNEIAYNAKAGVRIEMGRNNIVGVGLDDSGSGNTIHDNTRGVDVDSMSAPTAAQMAWRNTIRGNNFTGGNGSGNPNISLNTDATGSLLGDDTVGTSVGNNNAGIATLQVADFRPAGANPASPSTWYYTFAGFAAPNALIDFYISQGSAFGGTPMTVDGTPTGALITGQADTTGYFHFSFGGTGTVPYTVANGYTIFVQQTLNDPTTPQRDGSTGLLRGQGYPLKSAGTLTATKAIQGCSSDPCVYHLTTPPPTLTFSITLTNSSNAETVLLNDVDDQLDPAFTFVPGSISCAVTGGSTCPSAVNNTGFPAAPYTLLKSDESVDPNTHIAAWNGTVASGSSLTVTFQVTLSGNGAEGTPVANTATGTYDPIPVPFTSNTIHAVIAYPKLQVTKKVVSPDPAQPIAVGSVVTYEVSVSNVGHEDATNVSISDEFTLPLTEGAVVDNPTTPVQTGGDASGFTFAVPPTAQDTPATIATGASLLGITGSRVAGQVLTFQYSVTLDAKTPNSTSSVPVAPGQPAQIQTLRPMINTVTATAKNAPQSASASATLNTVTNPYLLNFTSSARFVSGPLAPNLKVGAKQLLSFTDSTTAAPVAHLIPGDVLSLSFQIRNDSTDPAKILHAITVGLPVQSTGIAYIPGSATFTMAGGATGFALNVSAPLPIVSGGTLAPGQSVAVTFLVVITTNTPQNTASLQMRATSSELFTLLSTPLPAQVSSLASFAAPNVSAAPSLALSLSADNNVLQATPALATDPAQPLTLSLSLTNRTGVAITTPTILTLKIVGGLAFDPAAFTTDFMAANAALSGVQVQATQSTVVVTLPGTIGMGAHLTVSYPFKVKGDAKTRGKLLSFRLSTKAPTLVPPATTPKVLTFSTNTVAVIRQAADVADGTGDLAQAGTTTPASEKQSTRDSVTLKAKIFAAGEPVAISLIAPDGTVTPVNWALVSPRKPVLRATASGGLKATVPLLRALGLDLKTGVVPAGMWRIVAVGGWSGLIVDGGFRVLPPA